MAASASGADLREIRSLIDSGKGRIALPALQEVIADCTSALPRLSDASKSVYSEALGNLYRLAMRYGDRNLIHEFEELASRDFPQDSLLLTLRGNLAFHRGDYEEARVLWQSALDLVPSNLEARYRLLELREWSENPETLGHEYQWFLDFYNRTDEIDPSDLEWIGRACVKLEKYEWDGAQKAYQEALDASPTLESVLLAKGDLWADRYDPESAIRFYSSILETNPESVDAYLGIATAHRENGNFSGLKRMLDRVLLVNPTHPLALAYMADLYYYDIEYEKGDEYLEKGFRSNPNHPVLLAVQASYAIKRKRQDLLDEVLGKVSSLFPNPARYHFLVADCLQRNYLFEESDREYQIGLSTFPTAKRAIAARAMLQSRVSPASAESAFEKMKDAFSRDPFHVRLLNMRDLFEERNEFEVGESEHFRIRCPQGAMEVYGGAALKALEEDYTDLAAKYPYQPHSKVLVEFYENPNNFSLRIAGLPGTGLSGVCFGEILIVKAPNRFHPENYNWGNVLRHELVHMFTLGLSDSRLPRWYTEGLSVAEEWDPNIQADGILIRRYRSNNLFSLKDFDRAFHRPDGMTAIWTAYQQAGDAVRYLTDRFGFRVHLELLAEFSKGLDTPNAFRAVVPVDLDELDRGIRSQVGKRVLAGLTPHQRARMRTTEISDTTSEAKLDKREKALLEMDRSYLAQDWDQLLDLSQEWLIEHPKDIPFLEFYALANYRKGDKRESRKTLEKIFEATSESYIANQVMGWIDRDFRRWDRAVDHLLKAHDLLPRNIGPDSPIRQAEKILRERRKWKRLYEVIAIRLQMQPDDADAYRMLAEQALEKGAIEVARESVRQAVFIHPFDPDIQVLWGKTLLEEGKTDEAIQRFQVARRLDPQSGKPLLALAEARLESGSREGAIRLAREALELDPTLEEARDILLGLP